jgi:hypothetical protein
MASQHSGRRIPGPNGMKAARKYVRYYPDHAAQYIFDTCDPVQQLQLACANRGQSDEHYHRIMLQDSDPEDDTKSQSSRRRTMSSGELVRYNKGHLSSFGTVSIEWARKYAQLGSKLAQQNTFYVVDELPGTQVVFGDSEPEASPVDHPGGISSTFSR